METRYEFDDLDSSIVSIPSIENAHTPSEVEGFIGANILPLRDDAPPKVAYKILSFQFEHAQRLGFKHVWFNPISPLPVLTPLSRIDLDLGIRVTQYNSLYAPEDPKLVRNVFKDPKIVHLIQNAKQQYGLTVLVDFVWKHVSENSTLMKTNPEWFGKKIKDIYEYNFNGPHKTAIINHLKQVIDNYYNLGFRGFRIDAASHLTEEVRAEIIRHMRSKDANIVILEEVLFDRNEELRIGRLAHEAMEKDLFSSYVTSNLYYQQKDVHGALPHPTVMGDSTKLCLANHRGIGFTGNHDHYSIGFGVLLFLAACRFKTLLDFQNKVRDLKASVLRNDTFDGEKALAIILQIADGRHSVESLSEQEQSVIRILLPLANEIAYEILTNEKSFSHTEFVRLLFDKMTDRTLASISGYFYLYCELGNLFETQRIFSNKDNGPLAFILLRAQDLLTNLSLTADIIRKMDKELELPAKKDKYDNLSNFRKAVAIPDEVLVPVLEDKSKQKTSQKKPVKVKKSNKNAMGIEDATNNMRLWVPFILDYLRNNPSANKFPEYANPKAFLEKQQEIVRKIGMEEFIAQINRIFSKLKTVNSHDYYTFTSLDSIKIIVRCLEKTTDIIIINLTPDTMRIINDIDLIKIALWFQSRLFPYPPSDKTPCMLSQPCNGSNPVYYDANYSKYWSEREKEKFDHAYNRIMGNAEDHETFLYVGLGFNVDITEAKVKIAEHVKSKQQQQNDAFHTLKPKGNSLTLDATPEAEKPVVSSPKAIAPPSNYSQLSTNLFPPNTQQPTIGATSKSGINENKMEKSSYS